MQAGDPSLRADLSARAGNQTGRLQLSFNLRTPYIDGNGARWIACWSSTYAAYLDHRFRLRGPGFRRAGHGPRRCGCERRQRAGEPGHRLRRRPVPRLQRRRNHRLRAQARRRALSHPRALARHR
ncbi:hypothetical protein NOVOSPHI9U_50173 [Novosphingobium sp. 9U]|nr:hypothetical protein NOVOSPHI9U_50173 [Novosphingobium sp. 9U]